MKKLKVFIYSENSDGSYFYRGEVLKKITNDKFLVTSNVNFSLGKAVFGKSEINEMVNSDLVIFVRPIKPISVLLFTYLKLKNKKIVLSIDDSVFKISEDNPHYIPVHKNWDNYKFYLYNSDALIVTNEYLKNDFLKYNTNIFIGANYLDSNLIKSLVNNDDKENQNKNKVRIGLIGSVATKENLEYLIPTLEEIALKENVTFVAAGGDEGYLRGLKNFSNKIEFNLPVENKDYFSFLQNLNLDFAIIPRKESYFNASKSDCKLLEFSYFGIPAIVQGFKKYKSPYEELLINGVNGFVATNKDNWMRELKLLIEDEKLRKVLSKNSKKIAIKKDILKNLNEWEDIFNEISKLPIRQIGNLQKSDVLMSAILSVKLLDEELVDKINWIKHLEKDIVILNKEIVEINSKNEKKLSNIFKKKNL